MDLCVECTICRGECGWLITSFDTDSSIDSWRLVLQLRSQLNHTKSVRPVQSRLSEKGSSCSTCSERYSVPSRICPKPAKQMTSISPAERRNSTPPSPTGSSRLANRRTAWNFVKKGTPSHETQRKHISTSTAYSESIIACTSERERCHAVNSVRPRVKQCSATNAMALDVDTKRCSGTSRLDKSGGSAGYSMRRIALSTEKNSVLCHMRKKSSTQLHRKRLSRAESSPHRAWSAIL